jgi:hypothetical protein
MGLKSSVDSRLFLMADGVLLLTIGASIAGFQ